LSFGYCFTTGANGSVVHFCGGAGAADVDGTADVLAVGVVLDDGVVDAFFPGVAVGVVDGFGAWRAVSGRAPAFCPDAPEPDGAPAVAAVLPLGDTELLAFPLDEGASDALALVPLLGVLVAGACLPV
jgi:hypothetical protein